MTDPLRVLAVDDEPAVAELIAEFLPREDDRFDVETATSAVAALERLDDETYDAIISDYQMPEMDGLEFLETVRNDRDSDIPFLIFTGRGREEVAIEALNLGADRYLQKGGDPVSQYRVLADAVANEIEKRRAETELETLNAELEARNHQLEAYTEQLEATEQQLRAEIEQRKEREQELTRHKQLLDALFDFVPIHLFIKDREGRHRWVSTEFYDNPERWIGKRDTEVEYPVPEAFSEAAYADDMRVIDNGERIIDKEEYDPVQERYFLTSKVPWRDEDGDVIGLLGYTFDITEQKQREQQLRALIDNLPGIVYRCERERGWPMELVRGQSRELTGYVADEIESGAVSWGEDVVHPADRQRVWNAVDSAITNDEPFELSYRIQTKTGEERWVRERGQQTTDDAVDTERLEGFITDITDQKERERELQVLKERFELALGVANLGVWDWNWETDEIEFNDNLVKMLGYDPDTHSAQIEHWKELVHPADVTTLEAAIQEHDESESPYYDTEFRIRTADGEWQWIRTIGQISERDADGEPLRAVGINFDVSDRKTVEEELRRERDRLAALHDAATDIEAAATESDVYETLTTVAEDILDFALVAVDTVKDDALVQQAWSRDERGDFYERVPLDEDTLSCRSYHRGETIVVDNLANYDITPADPEYRSALTVPIGEIGTFQAVSRESGAFDETDKELAELLVGHAREALLRIDQERSLREQRERLRRENDRLEEFASLVSHDLRNPLNVAIGRVALAGMECDSEHLGVIEHSLERMDTLISDLLALAREGKTVGEVEVVSLEELVSECWDTVETPGGTIQTDAPPTISADPERLKTVLENLFRNAIDHGGEEVTVTVGAIDEKAGFYVVDDGSGVVTEDFTDIFETGFSTHQDGTGIGLSIVKQIVDAHGWEIDVTEGASGGARFEITGVETIQSELE